MELNLFSLLLWAFTVLSVISFLLMLTGLARPSLLSKNPTTTRESISAIYGSVFLISFFLMGVTYAANQEYQANFEHSKALRSEIIRAARVEPTLTQKDSLDEYFQIEAQAFNGDIDSQRRLAFWLSGGIKKQPINPVLGCSWRIVILRSGSEKVDMSDTLTKANYCDKILTNSQLIVANEQALNLQRHISNKFK